jgi:hypothetical protein
MFKTILVPTHMYNRNMMKRVVSLHVVYKLLFTPFRTIKRLAGGDAMLQLHQTTKFSCKSPCLSRYILHQTDTVVLLLESESLVRRGGVSLLLVPTRLFWKKLSKSCEVSSRIFASFTHPDFSFIFYVDFFESRE